MRKVLPGLAMLIVFMIMSVPAGFAQFGPSTKLVRDAEPGSVLAGNGADASAVTLLSPEVALSTYEQRLERESAMLAGYSDDTLMIASLPDTKQAAEYELKRSYSAPGTLRYTPVRFSGDTFVKSNVLLRLLHAEVDHTLKREAPLTAINEKNYKFTHKSIEQLDGRAVYVYHVKPRKKRVGLFKGTVYLDASTGSMVRAEGTLVKSPSFFIRKAEFVQEYGEVAGFMLPTHIRSVAKVHVIGRTIVDVFHRDYQPQRMSSKSREVSGIPFNAN